MFMFGKKKRLELARRLGFVRFSHYKGKLIGEKQNNPGNWFEVPSTKKMKLAFKNGGSISYPHIERS